MKNLQIKIARSHSNVVANLSVLQVVITELKAEGRCHMDLEHRQVKYINNIIESDHGKLKRLIKPTLGFKSMKTAYATIICYHKRI